MIVTRFNFSWNEYSPLQFFHSDRAWINYLPIRLWYFKKIKNASKIQSLLRRLRKHGCKKCLIKLTFTSARESNFARIHGNLDLALAHLSSNVHKDFVQQHAAFPKQALLLETQNFRGIPVIIPRISLSLAHIFQRCSWIPHYEILRDFLFLIINRANVKTVSIDFSNFDRIKIARRRIEGWWCVACSCPRFLWLSKKRCGTGSPLSTTIPNLVFERIALFLSELWFSWLLGLKCLFHHRVQL